MKSILSHIFITALIALALIYLLIQLDNAEIIHLPGTNDFDERGYAKPPHLHEDQLAKEEVKVMNQADKPAK